MFNAASKLQGIRKGGGASVDPFFSNVVLLMHMNGPNGGIDFPDIKGHAITRFGDPITTDAWSAFAGGSSALFNQTPGPDYLKLPGSADFTFPGDVTIELTMNLLSVTGNQTVVGNYTNNATGQWMFRMQGATPVWYVNGSGAGSFTMNATTLAIGQKNSIALVRNGTTCTGYINGTAVGNPLLNISATLGLATAANAFTIGAQANGGIPGKLYIEEIRITKGIARYTSNYTPSTEPFPDS